MRRLGTPRYILGIDVARYNVLISRKLQCITSLWSRINQLLLCVLLVFSHAYALPLNIHTHQLFHENWSNGSKLKWEKDVVSSMFDIFKGNAVYHQCASRFSLVSADKRRTSWLTHLNKQRLYFLTLMHRVNRLLHTYTIYSVIKWYMPKHHSKNAFKISTQTGCKLTQRCAQIYLLQSHLRW